MKKVSEISFVYIGLVIGAGFASGREILEYFNFCSRSDFSGIILAALFFAVISYIIMHLANIYGADSFDRFIDRAAGRAAFAVKAFMFLYMFCGFFIMLSGSGTLLSRTFSVPVRYGIFLLAAVCFVIFSFDVKGLVIMSNFMVPIMIAGMAFLCITSILCGTTPAFAAIRKLHSNPLTAAVCYAAYNTITAGAVLVPVSVNTDRKTLAKAAVISSSVLGLLIFIVWTTLNTFYAETADAEMPLLELSIASGQVFEIIYTCVMFMALCTTAVSHGFGILSKLQIKKLPDRILASAALCASAIPFAKIGFSDLIANLYSAFGYAGIVWLVMLIFTYIRTDGKG